jgi:hypothetical protein
MADNTAASTERLAAILAEENAALIAFDLGKTASLLLAKREATAQLLEAQKNGAAAPGPQFAAALERIRELAEQNRILLLRAMTAQRRVMELVAQAAARPRPASCYAASGLHEAGQATPLALLAQA